MVLSLSVLLSPRMEGSGPLICFTLHGFHHALPDRKDRVAIAECRVYIHRQALLDELNTWEFTQSPRV